MIRTNFFNLSDDKLFYDERKKRFVYMDNVPVFVEQAYKNSHFKEVSLSTHCRDSMKTLAKARSLWATVSRMEAQVQIRVATPQTDELPDQA